MNIPRLIRLALAEVFMTQRIVSRPGKKDGLYWLSAEGEVSSPVGELSAKAAAEGYKPGSTPSPYHGYYYRTFSTRPIFCGLEPGVPIVMGLRGCKGPPVTVVHIRLWRLRCLAHVSYDPKSGHFLLTQNGHFCRRSGDLNLGIGQSPRKSG